MNDLLRMYSRYAAIKKWKVEEIDEGIVKFIGKDAYETLKYEGGVHRVQRVPATESQGRIHTSTASVAVLPEVLPPQLRLKTMTWNGSLRVPADMEDKM